MAMNNDDFRKLLASTPRRSVDETPSRNEGQTHSFTHKAKPKFKAPLAKNHHKQKKIDKTEEDEEAARLKEILKNYRDRAAERRDKGGTDETDELIKLTAAYQSVPGSARESRDAAHARRRAIEESKFLGGDMEHTHLVKGLDYSLLHKVRSEIDRSGGNEEDIEKAYEEAAAELVPTLPTAAQSKMVKNINQVLFKNELPQRNDLFKKGRMAYVVELEEENNEDVPTTLLRSLIDCPNNESNSNINANNMLISKLTQVLSYLRADHKKKKRPDMSEDDIVKYQSQSIYDNESEYVPKRDKEKEREKESEKDDREKEREKDREKRDDREKERDRKKTSSYFDDRDKVRDDRDRRDRDRNDRDYDRRDRDRDRRDHRDDRRDREKEREREKMEREREKKEKEQAEKEKRLEERMEKRRKETEGGGYDECYPGGFAEMGGTWGDSDEEEDFTKMDMNMKKGAIKRWDFENQDDYEKFQGGREAVPKAAFQFGLKTQDGRKTKKTEAANNKKLDRELVEITKINEKRKQATESGESYKKPKY